MTHHNFLTFCLSLSALNSTYSSTKTCSLYSSYSPLPKLFFTIVILLYQFCFTLKFLFPIIINISLSICNTYFVYQFFFSLYFLFSHTISLSLPSSSSPLPFSLLFHFMFFFLPYQYFISLQFLFSFTLPFLFHLQFLFFLTKSLSLYNPYFSLPLPILFPFIVLMFPYQFPSFLLFLSFSLYSSYFLLPLPILFHLHFFFSLTNTISLYSSYFLLPLPILFHFHFFSTLPMFFLFTVSIFHYCTFCCISFSSLQSLFSFQFYFCCLFTKPHLVGYFLFASSYSYLHYKYLFFTCSLFFHSSGCRLCE
ncbi:unnamed protein product [Acanthosepion pharaonis]|uniref:Uncharacterized protein n=1 Tax=Acanthosepion pharaonis TaxID=158019 RepID=A0A812EBK3_ACAPH|nr:unnamed protein product [Sepia pharaonis]